MPFKTLALKEEAKQVIKNAQAEERLRPGTYRAIAMNKEGQAHVVGCAVGHLAMSAGYVSTGQHGHPYGVAAGKFGLDADDLGRIEGAYERPIGLSPIERAERALAAIDAIEVA